MWHITKTQGMLTPSRPESQRPFGGPSTSAFTTKEVWRLMANTATDNQIRHGAARLTRGIRFPWWSRFLRALKRGLL